MVSVPFSSPRLSFRAHVVVVSLGIQHDRIRRRVEKVESS